MTHNEVFEVLEELSLPIAYDHFAEGESPDPPFLCFLYPRKSSNRRRQYGVLPAA